MALSSYSDLQAAVANWLHRDDLASSVPDFIALAEARMNRDLRVRQQITGATLTTTAGVATVALPADWLQFSRLRLLVPDRPLEVLAEPRFTVMYRASDTGAPVHARIDGANLVLGPKPDAVYSIEAAYFAAVPALSGTNPTNWLLGAWPGLYLLQAVVAHQVAACWVAARRSTQQRQRPQAKQEAPAWQGYRQQTGRRCTAPKATARACLAPRPAPSTRWPA